MKFKTVALLFALTFSSTYSLGAYAYDIDVLVLFDRDTTDFSSSEMQKQTAFFIKSLNQTMENSKLDHRVNFRPVSKGKGYAKTIAMAGKSSFDSLIKHYEGSFIPIFRRTLPENHIIYNYQKYYKADLTIVVANPSSERSCGKAITPVKGNKDSGMNTYDLLKVAHFGVVFIKGDKGCLSSDKVISHEVGHSFGLVHGKAVKNETGQIGDYPSSSILESFAGGHASYQRYGEFHTVMGLSTTYGAKNWHNFFSNSRRNDCGYWKNKSCGNSSANAKAYINKYAYSFSKRSEWWR